MSTPTNAPFLLNGGVAELMNNAFAASGAGVVVTPALRLYTNNVTLDNTKTLVDFTEALDPGSRDRGLAPITDWTPITVEDGIQSTEIPDQLIEFDGTPVEIYYGYVIYNTGTGVAYWASSFMSPIPNTGGPDAILIQISVQFGELDAS